MATIDFFLKMDGIPGESKDLKHKGEIDLESFSWAETNPSKPSTGRGGGSGKVAMQDLSFVTRVNKASPLLFLACATGKHIKEAILTARKAGKGPLDYLIIKFKDVIVSSYQIGGSEGGAAAPMEQVSFNFGRIDFEYREQKPDGTLASPITAGWDVLTSKQT